MQDSFRLLQADSVPDSGNREYRHELKLCFGSRQLRDERWQILIDRHQQNWVQAGRIRSQPRMTRTRFLLHAVLRKITPVGLHRFLSDSDQRRDLAVSCLLLLSSRRCLSVFGQRRVVGSIERELAGRIGHAEAEALRADLSGNEVRFTLAALACIWGSKHWGL